MATRPAIAQFPVVPLCSRLACAQTHERERAQAQREAGGAATVDGMMAGAQQAGTRTGDVRLRVRYAETDQMGFVYHAHYLVWCEIGRTELLRQLGATYAELERAGTILAVADASVRYELAARYDDAILVRTQVERVRSRAIAFTYEIFREEGDGTLVQLATAATRLISIDSCGSTRSLPTAIVQRLRAHASV